MAEHDDTQDRTERPTQKRLHDAREEGNVARSRELATAMVVTVAAVSMFFIGPMMVHDIRAIATDAMSLSRTEIYDPDILLIFLLHSLLQTLRALAPFFAVMFVAAAAAPLALGGWVSSMKPLALNLERLDPVKGIKRVFGPQGLMELAKALVKFALLAFTAVLVIRLVDRQMLRLGFENVGAAMSDSMHLIILSVLSLCVALFIVAAVDVPFQLWNHFRKLRMTRQEVRDELKQTEGDPELRGRIRSIQRDMSRRRMMGDVPKADVVLVNPTHYAVALKYDDSKAAAPKVLAKGTDLIASKIREIAEHHKVHIFAEPALTRALYYSTDVGREIPRALYVAVAQVLAYVYQVNRAQKYGGPMPEKPVDLPVPESMARGRRH